MIRSLTCHLRTGYRCCSTVPLTVHNLAERTSQEPQVKIQGWVQRVQKRGKLNFIHVNDGLSPQSIQVVVPKELCASAPVGSAISVVGSWQASSGSQQNMELSARSCDVISTDVDPRYSSLSPDQLRKMVHLRSRNQSFAALLRVRSRLFRATHDFFMDREYVHIDTPIFTANDCEEAGETFSVTCEDDKDAAQFFGREKVYLSVSGQLHLEAMSSGISRVYSLNGGFRAEKQQSSSHLTEFRMLEAELAFCDDLDEICQLAEDYLKYTCNFLLNDAKLIKDVDALGLFSDKEHTKSVSNVASSTRFARLRYDEAVRILTGKKQKMTGNGLNKQNEAYLVKYCGDQPVFITHFPTNQKPFYMKRSADDSVTESFDLLCPIVGELAGGSVREPSEQLLRERGASIDWYLECRRRGKPVSAGFGLGFERLLQVLLGVRNIKDTTPFPRWFKHCQC